MLRRIVIVLVVLASLGSLPAVASADGTCPNEAIRERQGATYLPDCRAYELVSPSDKNGYDTRITGSSARSSDNGEAFTYGTIGTAPGTEAQGSTFVPRYLAQRSATGWQSRDTDPLMGAHPLYTLFGYIAELQDPIAWSSDLSTALTMTYRAELAPGADKERINVYLRHNSDGGYELLSKSMLGPLGPDPNFFRPWFADASADFHHIIFETGENLTADANGSAWKLYEWEDGVVRLVGILPDGTPSPEGSVAGPAAGPSQPEESAANRTEHTISSDGRRVFFTAGPGPGGALYMRQDGGRPGAATVQLNASEKTTPEASQPALFRDASADGSEIYFTTAEQLVDGDTNTTVDLYRYSVDASAGHHLTLVSNGSGPGEVIGFAGLSADGTTAYFVTAGTETGAEAHGELYAWNHGAPHFIGSGVDASSYNPVESRRKITRVSADGRYLLFRSVAPLTGFDNHINPFNRASELFLYDANTGHVACVSCDPSGAAPRGSATAAEGNSPLVSATRYMPRILVEDGGAVHIFFETPDPLLPEDTNSARDVYEYNSADGSVRLLSSGHNANDSWFMDASVDGRDVFIASHARLTATDPDELWDIYDARVDGGFPEPAGQPACEGSTCQGRPGAAPMFASPSSALLSGSGNLTPASTRAPRLVVKPPTAAQLRAKALTKALKACKKRPKAKRRHCESAARRRYAVPRRSKATKPPRRSK